MREWHGHTQQQKKQEPSSQHSVLDFKHPQISWHDAVHGQSAAGASWVKEQHQHKQWQHPVVRTAAAATSAADSGDRSNGDEAVGNSGSRGSNRSWQKHWHWQRAVDWTSTAESVTIQWMRSHKHRTKLGKTQKKWHDNEEKRQHKQKQQRTNAISKLKKGAKKQTATSGGADKWHSGLAAVSWRPAATKPPYQAPYTEYQEHEQTEHNK